MYGTRTLKSLWLVFNNINNVMLFKIINNKFNLDNEMNDLNFSHINVYFFF